MKTLRVILVGSLAAALGFLVGNLAIPSLNTPPPARAVEEITPLAELPPVPEPERVVPKGEGDVRLSFAPVVREVFERIERVLSARAGQRKRHVA